MKSIPSQSVIGWFGFHAIHGGVGRHRYGLKGILQKMCAEVLIPSTSECDFI